MKARQRELQTIVIVSALVLGIPFEGAAQSSSWLPGERDIAAAYKAAETSGDRNKKAELARQWLALNLKHRRESEYSTALVYRLVGTAEVEAGNIGIGITHLRKAVSLFEGHGGEKAEIARLQARSNLASALAHSGDLPGAISEVTESMGLVEKSLGPESEMAGQLLNTLGSLQRQLGQFGKSIESLRRSLAIREKIHGPGSRKALESWNSLALAHLDGGEAEEALAIFERILPLANVDTDKDQLASVTNNLAQSLSNLGRYREAEGAYEKAIALSAAPDGIPTLSAVSHRLNLAALRFKFGELARSRLDLEELTALVDDHWPALPVTAVAHNNLAEVMAAQGQLEPALAEMTRSLEVKLKQSGGRKTPSIALAFDNLGRLHLSKRDFAAAIETFQAGLEIRQETLGKLHPVTSRSWYNLGMSLFRSGNLERSADCFLAAADIVNRTYEGDHAWRASVLQGAGVICGLTDVAPAEKADDLIRQGAQLARQSFLLAMATGDESRRLNAWSDLQPGWAEANVGNAAGLADVVLNTRGVVLESLIRDRRAAERGAKEGSELWKRYLDMRRELRDLLNRDPKLAASDGIRPHLDELSKVARELSGASAFVSDEVTWQEMQRALRPNEIVLQYLSFPKWLPSGEIRDTIGLVVIRPGSEPPTIHECGPTREIAGLVETHRQELLEAVRLREDDFEEALQHSGVFDDCSRKLYHQLLGHVFGDSLAAHRSTLAEEAEAAIWVVPEGVLNFLAFSSLVDSEGETLLNQATVRLIGSGRDLLKNAHRPAKLSALLVGDPDFDAAISPADAAVRKSDLPFVSGVSLEDLSFPPLPGTAEELEVIARLLKDHEIEFELLSGGHASEIGLRSATPPSVLHLATHGFFLTPDRQGEAITPGAPGSGASLWRSDGMMRSGLALAGAATRLTGVQADPENDGIAFAMELAESDWEPVWLAVLSACETGLGDELPGGGVSGLQRAFHFAGADHVLMSLWPVGDLETSEWMTDFYASLLSGKKIDDSVSVTSRRLFSKTLERSNRAVAIWASSGFVLSSRARTD